MPKALNMETIDETIAYTTRATTAAAPVFQSTGSLSSIPFPYPSQSAINRYDRLSELLSGEIVSVI